MLLWYFTWRPMGMAYGNNNMNTVIRILQLIKLTLPQSHWIIVFSVTTNVHKTKECLAAKKKQYIEI